MEFLLRPEPYIASYRADLEELSKLLQSCGFTLQPYKDFSLPEFHNLLPETRQHVAQALHAYVGALKAELLEGTMNPERFVLQFLFRIGQAPNSDLYDLLRNERYIQIYNRDNLQIFRSLACYERCSFTLEQLTSRTWFELWERDNLFYMAFLGMAHKMRDVVKFSCFNFDFPFHKVTEIDSAMNYSFHYKLKTVCGLTRQNQIQSALLIEDWEF
ncbi:hypothetical protein B9G69_000880 [Bdellovibrio sp. SKB1291214]|uniref:hypothetical protein n=1 Tax=Bdellovibrio sp. SKB1291214 TaxID=1732569 RepID=UPI000B51A50E|nr:hypothetical protein [Bdellovibrio sp. SKB1291214]UYL09129.1 hypothetical protein B9G69_000880 [Bdellovibrio sp. SKB1291214]